MAKIIIETLDGIGEQTAIECVLDVIKSGKISQKGKSYCTGSSFDSGELVSARCNVNGTHKFVVSKEKGITNFTRKKVKSC